MPSLLQLKSIYRRFGWVEKVFAVLIVLYAALVAAAPNSGWTVLVQLLWIFFGCWLLIRLIRAASRRVIWRLRNRLIVTYLFIAVVPVFLILTLLGLAAWTATSQVAIYFVTSELGRRVDSLKALTTSLAQTDPGVRTNTMRSLGDAIFRDRYPGLTLISRGAAGVTRYPENSGIDPPPPGWGDVSGVVRREGRFYAWSHAPTKDGDITAFFPLTRSYLSTMVPNLGLVYFSYLRETGQKTSNKRLALGQRSFEIQPEAAADQVDHTPPAVGWFDPEVPWFSISPVAVWEKPPSDEVALLAVRSRLSAVVGLLFSRKADMLEGVLPILLTAVAVLFLVVEIVCLVIGISMTRTITGAVHHLYEGTSKVMMGDLTHRIEVKGRDQLADLSHSFNRMTEHLQQLLEVAREKERLQSEIEIAREVQNQLYPKRAPDTRTLRLTAVCKPARMVSGDYFDYECMRDSKVAIAIGDVAGKGISAALLMATLQSSLRTELRGAFEMAMVAGNGAKLVETSTSELVSHLNEQLHAYTSPEKYATFYLGIYDENSAQLTYTNAGHLPPILVRDGNPVRLNVDGTVVGAFPFSQYDESKIDLKAGDLLVCFTDGVSEPENEYGEMFGEDRLVELVSKNVYRTDEQIIELVTEAVEQWTGSPELQDDMTLLLARRT